MCDTIQELDKKNDKAHLKIETKVDEGLRSIEDTLTERHIELSNKVDVAVERMEATTGNLKAAATTTRMYKGIVLLLLAVMSIGGVLSYLNSKDIANTKIETWNILQQIHQDIRESTTVTKNLDTKALMDTISDHWKKTNEFYKNEFLPQVRWTKDIRDHEILPAYKSSRKNTALIKDHEIRLSRIEIKNKSKIN